jgi:hypothetical protein
LSLPENLSAELLTRNDPSFGSSLSPENADMSNISAPMIDPFSSEISQG